jgi:hypothetical protein
MIGVRRRIQMIAKWRLDPKPPNLNLNLRTQAIAQSRAYPSRVEDDPEKWDGGEGYAETESSLLDVMFRRIADSTGLDDWDDRAALDVLIAISSFPPSMGGEGAARNAAVGAVSSWIAERWVFRPSELLVAKIGTDTPMPSPSLLQAG